jgi:tubulin-specific chaperone E
LRELQISSNKLENIGDISDLKEIRWVSSGEVKEISPVGVFGNLLTLNLIDMDLSWKQICSVLKAFPILENLILCRNTLVDYENLILGENLGNLKFLNLENTL